MSVWVDLHQRTRYCTDRTHKDRRNTIATILYCRTSTVEQTLDHQLTQAQQAGFEIDEVIADPGVSGVSTKLIDRPQGKRLYDKLREGDVLVVRWVDRLGRNYEDVTTVIREFMMMGVTIRTVINNMTFDGTANDPIQKAVRDAVIAFMAATAQSQAEVTKAAQRAGIDTAMNDEMKYRGRKPSYDRRTYETIIDLLSNQMGNSAISRATGVSRQAVIRIRNNPELALKALRRWAD